MGPFGAPELLIVGAIVLLLFGVGRLSGLGKDLGSSIKEFRKAVKDEDKDGDKAEKPGQNVSNTQAPPPPQAPLAPPPASPAQAQPGDKPPIF